MLRPAVPPPARILRDGKPFEFRDEPAQETHVSVDVLEQGKGERAPRRRDSRDPAPLQTVPRSDESTSFATRGLGPCRHEPGVGLSRGCRCLASAASESSKPQQTVRGAFSDHGIRTGSSKDGRHSRSGGVDPGLWFEDVILLAPFVAGDYEVESVSVMRQRQPNVAGRNMGTGGRQVLSVLGVCFRLGRPGGGPRRPGGHGPPRPRGAAAFVMRGS